MRFGNVDNIIALGSALVTALQYAAVAVNSMPSSAKREESWFGDALGTEESYAALQGHLQDLSGMVMFSLGPDQWEVGFWFAIVLCGAWMSFISKVRCLPRPRPRPPLCHPTIRGACRHRT